MAERPVRMRLAVGLDVDSAERALEIMRAAGPWCGVAKVGYELYAAAGPAIVGKLRQLDVDVFLDLKLHDIPTTVQKGARVLGRLGIAYLNFHTAGGETMLRAGCDGLREGAADAGLPPPVPLGVTVLTSDPPDDELVRARAALARRAGCGGVVCGAPDLPHVREVFPGAVTMVPGIRSAGSAHDDQVRVATPAAAASAGADVLVVGRIVTGADDVAEAARRVHDEVAEALGAAGPDGPGKR